LEPRRHSSIAVAVTYVLFNKADDPVVPDPLAFSATIGYKCPPCICIPIAAT
jgi:hypothetical protein